MKIIVRTKEKSSGCGCPAACFLRQDFRPHRHRRHHQICPGLRHPAGGDGPAFAALRDFARTHPGWPLVDITTHKGDIVKITLRSLAQKAFRNHCPINPRSRPHAMGTALF